MHKSYWVLVRTYDRRGYNRCVHRITKRQLPISCPAMVGLSGAGWVGTLPNQPLGGHLRRFPKNVHQAVKGITNV